MVTAVESLNISWWDMSALSAGEPDECSVDVSLRTDKTRHYTTVQEKKNKKNWAVINFLRSYHRGKKIAKLIIFELMLAISLLSYLRKT